jgi:predicted nuclease of predicted toxin-antitoxin system
VRLKLDENIPASAGPRLSALGFDVDTVLAEGLQGRADEDVWTAARAESRMLVTQDLDFADVRKFAPGTHAGLFIVRLPDSEQWRLPDYLVGWFAARDVASWRGCFIVATPNKLRIIAASR